MDGCKDAHQEGAVVDFFFFSFFFFLKIGKVLFRQIFDLDFSKGRKMSLR